MFSKTPIESILPSNKLSLRSKVSRLVNKYSSVGRLPVNSLKSRSTKTRFVNKPISDGIVDERPAKNSKLMSNRDREIADRSIQYNFQDFCGRAMIENYSTK